MIDVRIEKKRSGVKATWVRRIIAKTLKAERSSAADIQVLVTDDKRIRAINKRHLKHDYATDVVSFDTGDIVVSADTARRYAKEHGISFHEELARYLVHGTLHIMGYDDKKKVDHQRMHARQEAILKKIL